MSSIVASSLSRDVFTETLPSNVSMRHSTNATGTQDALKQKTDLLFVTFYVTYFHEACHDR
jgi:hypothetical protein